MSLEQDVEIFRAHSSIKFFMWKKQHSPKRLIKQDLESAAHASGSVRLYLGTAVLQAKC